MTENLNKKPEWIRVKAPTSNGFAETLSIIRSCGVSTVCEDALCPNISECWKNGTATFLIMGEICTRCCGFCNIKNGVPSSLDPNEPDKIAEAVLKLNIKHAVITCVTRDDLKDGGAAHFAAVINAIRQKVPSANIEILTSDLQVSRASIETVVKAKPDVFGHNLEIVKKLHISVKKPPASYANSLNFLRIIKEIDPSMVTKTGIMVGVGENKEDVFELIDEVAKTSVNILTIGQYLTPSTSHYPIERYVSPEEFEEYKNYGEEKGLVVVSGPLVRSSYKAGTIFNSICHGK